MNSFPIVQRPTTLNFLPKKIEPIVLRSVGECISEYNNYRQEGSFAKYADLQSGTVSTGKYTLSGVLSGSLSRNTERCQNRLKTLISAV